MTDGQRMVRVSVRAERLRHEFMARDFAYHGQDAGVGDVAPGPDRLLAGRPRDDDPADRARRAAHRGCGTVAG